MHNLGSKQPCRILTDIQIKQSPYWCKKTEYLGTLSLNYKFINKIPLTLRNKLCYFFKLFLIIKHRNNYDVVINAQIKTGQLVALFRSIFRTKTPKQIILQLMLDEERPHLRWKLKKLIQRLAFSSVDLIFVSSTGEIATYSERFKMPKERFRFLPFHTDVIEPRIMNHSENYILSAGKTGRDYSTLANAIKEVKQNVIIVADALSLRDVTFPPNAKVLIDIPYSDYLDLLYNCSLVVVPLKKLAKSTGQVAILEAMALGKPVIATQTIGTIDYIQTGLNGILVPVGDAQALRDAIEKLTNDAALHKTIAFNAFECVKNYYTFDKYTSSILKAAWEVAGISKT